MKTFKRQGGGIFNDSDTSRGECQYGNYYDDVPVVDLSETKQKKSSNGNVLRVCLVVFGLVITIAVCITAMCLI